MKHEQSPEYLKKSTSAQSLDTVNYKKMLYKIVACRCNGLVLEEKEKENISSIKGSFRCECNRFHEVLVWTCKDHPFVCDAINPNKTCFCCQCAQNEVCAVCVEKRYKVLFHCVA